MISTKEGKIMAKLTLAITFLLSANVSIADTGNKNCIEKKSFLRDICKEQKLEGTTAHFSECANGFSYEIVNDKQNLQVDSDFVTTEIQCKMVEVRQQDGIESRTTYFDRSNQKVVVYQHENGLANAYVYGHHGFYHITQFASGDSIYNFHSFDN
jgi:hypothetical protein